MLRSVVIACAVLGLGSVAYFLYALHSPDGAVCSTPPRKAIQTAAAAKKTAAAASSGRSGVRSDRSRHGNVTTHRCSGLYQAEDAARAGIRGPGLREAFVRSCEFINVCWLDSTFVYYSSPIVSHRMPFDHGSGNGTYGGGVDALPAVALVSTAGVVQPGVPVPVLPLRQVFGEIPANARWLEGGPAIPIIRHIANNFGHLTAEVIWPMFALMQTFADGEVDEYIRQDVQFLLLDDCFDTRNIFVSFPGGPNQRKLCDRLTRSALGLLSHTPPISPRRFPSGRPTCFRRLLAGISPFVYLHSTTSNSGGKAALLRQFGDFVAAKHGVKRRLVKGPADPWRIVILAKSKVQFNSRDIGNAAELVAFFADKLPRYEGRRVVVDTVDVGNCTVMEQVVLVNAADVVISPSGGTAFLAPFLRASSTLIVVPLCSRTDTCLTTDCYCKAGFCCYQYEGEVWTAMRSPVLVASVAVPEDIMGKCECTIITCVDCRVRVNPTRLLELVLRGLFYSGEFDRAHFDDANAK